MRFPLSFVCCSLFLATTSVVVAQTSATSEPDYKSNPKFQAAWKEGHELQLKKQFGFSVDAYKKANKIAGGQCVECLRSLIDVQTADGAYKDAISSASALEALATTPSAKSTAAFLLGRAILARAGKKPKPADLEAADAAFKQAIANSPKAAAVHYLDGQTLARLGKMDEAKAEFLTCVSCASPNDPSRLRAQHFAENPELSTRQMAPAFTVTALDGSKFTLDEMGGRVVLIDFWATWCGPCNEELPEMKKIAKEFAGQPLVIISVSWDRDETAWKNFVAKNEMTWVQYRDADHKLTDSFGISAIPHYFTIDSDGVLTSEMLGSGSDVEGKLKKLVAKAREAQTSAIPAQTTGN